MPAPRAAEQSLPQEVRILLIEDQQPGAEIVKTYLERIEWAAPRIELARTLREALARLRLEHFDLVIADLDLPDSKGIATVEAVARACDRLIIVLSASDEPGLRETAIDRGAYELMRKGSLSQAALERLVKLATVQAGTVRSLRASETRFRKTFELAGSGIAHIDLDGRFLRVNRRMCEILGYPESELILCSVNDIAHSADGKPSDAGRQQRRYLRKDGSVVWVEVSIAPVRDARGEPQYEIAVMDDITERKRAETRQAAHTRYQEAIARFGQAALASRDSAELIDEAVQTALRGLGARGAAYVEAAPGEGELVLRTAAGDCGALPEDSVATVLHSGARFSGPASLIVPVRGEQRVRGALCALGRQGERFTGDGLGFLETAASLLSTGCSASTARGAWRSSPSSIR